MFCRSENERLRWGSVCGGVDNEESRTTGDGDKEAEFIDGGGSM